MAKKSAGTSSSSVTDSAAALVAAAIFKSALPKLASQIRVSGLSQEKVVRIAFDLFDQKRIKGIELRGQDIWVERVTLQGREIAKSAAKTKAPKKRSTTSWPIDI